MDWQQLTQLTAGAPFIVERVRLTANGIVIEGAFELPLLAQLPPADQVFVAAFIRSHGSIKEMERLFGVSYPTIKARLNRLSEHLGPVLQIDAAAVEAAPAVDRGAVLSRLERGEITVEQALAELSR